VSKHGVGTAGLVILVAVLALQAPATHPIRAMQQETAGDAETVTRLVERYFDLYAAGDLPELQALWDTTSPAFSRRFTEIRTFTSLQGHDIADLEVVRLVLESPERAVVRVSMNVQISRPSPRANITEFWFRELICLKRNDEWKVWSDTSPADTLADEIAKADTDEAMDGLMATEPDIPVPVLWRAIHRRSATAAGNPATRKNAPALHRLALLLTEKDHLELAAASHQALGNLHIWMANFPEAIEHLQLALDGFEATGQIEEAATTAGDLGAAFYARREYSPALAAYGRALVLEEKLGKADRLSAALGNVGLMHSMTHSPHIALEYQRRSLAAAEESGNEGHIARAAQNVGGALYSLGEYVEAAAHYERVAELESEQGNPYGVSAAMQGLALCWMALGEFQRALEGFHRVRELAQSLGDRIRVAESLRGIGVVHSRVDEHALALDAFHKALDIREATEDVGEIARLQVDIGSVHHSQGGLETAVERYRQGLAAFDKIGEPGLAADVEATIGDALFTRGDVEGALEQYQKTLTRRVKLNDPAGQGRAHLGIGLVQAELGDQDAALKAYLKAWTIFEAIGEEAFGAIALSLMAKTELASGDTCAALELAERAVESARPLGRLDIEAHALLTVARAHTKTNDSASAHGALHLALAAVERLQAEGGGQEAEPFFTDFVTPFLAMSELLATEGRAEEALAFAERGRAQALVEILGRRAGSITKGMSDEDVTRERLTRREVAAARARINRERDRRSPDRSLLDKLTALLRARKAEHAKLLEELYDTYPALGVARGRGSSIALDNLPSGFLDDRSAIIQFIVSEDRTCVFTLSAVPLDDDDDRSDRGVRLVQAAGEQEREMDRKAPLVGAVVQGEQETDRRAPLEDAAKQGAHGTTSVAVTVAVIDIGRKDLMLEVRRYLDLLSKREPQLSDASAGLHALLLAPAVSRLEGIEHITFVPDGQLWRLPFHALAPEGGRHLIEDFSVSYAPSISALVRMHLLAAARPAGEDVVFAVFDPEVEEETKERLARLYPQQQPATPSQHEREADVIRDIYGKEQVRVFSGAEATGAAITADAGAGRLLHLAAPGLVNDLTPMSSHLVLASSEDDAQRGDAILEAWEIANLDLGAGLVVLNNCHTLSSGTGRGLIGLAWTFYSAGVPALVVNQWLIAQPAREALMEAFHRALDIAAKSADAEDPARNISADPARKTAADPPRKATALRMAMRKMIADKAYRHPLDWAALFLVGDSR
jgi:CHAT domain-containing protein/tetratricopeptide (TPR) repeat protein